MLYWDKNPPHHIKIEATKDKDGAVTAELFGHKYISNKIEEKKETFKDRLMSKVGGPEKTVMKKVKEEEAAEKKEAKTKDEPKVEVKTEKPKEKKEVKAETEKPKPITKEPLNKSKDLLEPQVSEEEIKN